MVSTVAVDSVPKSDLPPRRMLWDILKPQAAQVLIADFYMQFVMLL